MCLYYCKHFIHRAKKIIIICDNNLLLTTATSLRATLHDKNIKQGTIKSTAHGKHEWRQFDRFSPDKNEDKREILTCEEAIVRGQINTLVVCGHNRRFEDTCEIIATFSSKGYSFNIHIYLN